MHPAKVSASIVLCVLGALAPAPLRAQSLVWNANSEPDLAGYRVYRGTTTGQYGTPVDVGNTTTHTPQGVDWTRRQYFAVQAYSTSGLTSTLSQEVEWIPPSITTLTSITASAAYPLTTGQTVTWTANGGNNLGAAEYRVWLFRRTSWTLARDWAQSNTFTWTPATTDQGSPNYIQIWARAVGSTAAYEAVYTTPQFEIRPAPLTLTANVDFPTPPGNQVTWTAAPAPGLAGPLEYRFLQFRESTGAWTAFREYASSNQAQWTPAAVGRYAIQVRARVVGSTVEFTHSATTELLDVSQTPLSISALFVNTTFPARTGTGITWTVRPQGGMAGPLQYQFWLFSDRTGWVNAQPYGPSQTFTWTPTWADEGQWALQVWARNNGSTAHYEAWRSTGLFQIQRAGLHLTAARLYPAAPGVPVTWTATVPDTTTAFEYVFWLYSGSTGQWTQGQAYSAQNTFTWTPSTAGTYYIQAWARQVGSTASWEVTRSSPLLEIAVGPAQMVSVTSNVSLPARTGTTITWSAAASGGTAALQYQFLRNSGTGWTIVQNYGASSSFTWTPTAANVGQHDLEVRVRSVGSTAAYESRMTTGTFSIQP